MADARRQARRAPNRPMRAGLGPVRVTGHPTTPHTTGRSQGTRPWQPAQARTSGTADAAGVSRHGAVGLKPTGVRAPDRGASPDHTAHTTGRTHGTQPWQPAQARTSGTADAAGVSRHGAVGPKPTGVRAPDRGASPDHTAHTTGRTHGTRPWQPAQTRTSGTADVAGVRPHGPVDLKPTGVRAPDRGTSPDHPATPHTPRAGHKARCLVTGPCVASRTWDSGRRQPRSTAPVRSAARATAVSRAADASSTVSVRSSARKRSAYARDLRPSPSCSAFS